MDRPLVFLDCETTGLGPDREPWEVALIRRETGRAADVSRHFMIPVIRELADPEALAVGGFHDRHPQGNRTGPEVLRQLGASHWMPLQAEAATFIANITADAVLVGANPWFDADTLEVLLRGYGLTPRWHYGHADIKSVVSGAHGRWIGSLDACVEATPVLDWAEGERHTAMGDARMVRALWDDYMGDDR